MKFQMLFCVIYWQQIAADSPQPTLNRSFFAENTGCLILNKTTTGKKKKKSNHHREKDDTWHTPPFSVQIILAGW